MNSQMNKRFIDFIITQKCTYRCKYCSQSKMHTKKLLDANKKTLNSFLNFLDTIDKDFEITITGGEAILHPEFFNLINEIKNKNFKINLISNFSFPIEVYYKIFALLDDNLNKFDLSFHLDEINDFEKTLQKLELFLNKKMNSTLTTLFIPEYNIDDSKREKINQIITIANKYDIPFEFQKIRILNKYQDKSFIPNSTFAHECYAGMYSAVIYENGNVYRCYSSRFLISNYLGNINNKKFKLKMKPQPCPMKNCTCSKPFIYNQITDKKRPFVAYLSNISNFIFMPILFFKNSANFKNKLKQFLDISKTHFTLL